MRKIKLHKISYKRVGFPTFLYDKKTYNFILTFAHDASFQKNHLFHIPYIDACTFLLNPLHASIEKDIAPVCYENNETKVTWGCYSLKNNSLSYYISLLEFDHRHTECD